MPMPRALDPIGSAREEFEIYRELEQRLRYGTGFSRGMTAAEWQEEIWEVMRGRVATAGHDLPGWQEFPERRHLASR